MDNANHHSIPGAVLPLDIKKAFDSEDWVFIRKVLDFFWFWAKNYQMDWNFVYKRFMLHNQ